MPKQIDVQTRIAFLSIVDILKSTEELALKKIITTGETHVFNHHKRNHQFNLFLDHFGSHLSLLLWLVCKKT